MNHHHHEPIEPIEIGNTEIDRADAPPPPLPSESLDARSEHGTGLVWMIGFLFIATIAIVLTAAFERHHPMHQRPQAAVVFHEPPAVKQEDRAPVGLPLAPVTDAAPVIPELRPSSTADATPAVSPQSADAPVGPASSLSGPPTATVADEAQYARDHTPRHPQFRPNHHHHQPRHRASADDGNGHDFVAAFFRATARLAGLIQ
jgi:hypothetical protein